MFDSCFPCITPFYYSIVLEQQYIKYLLNTRSFRMQPHYKKQFKKSK